MADEKQPATQPAADAAQSKLAQARQQRQQGDVGDRISDRELEFARLQNENLKMQNEMLARQEKIADAQLKAIEAAKPRDVLVEAQAKEDAIVARLKAMRDEAKRKLEEGPRKFWVHMAHQLPVGTTLQHPELLVGGHDEHEARRKYLAVLGVISTPHTPAVVEAFEGVECNSKELIAEAEKGYRPQAV
jgi:hypothetical protein